MPDAGHVVALEREVPAASWDRAPCENKVRRPPSEAVRAEAERLCGRQAAASDPAERVVIDLSHYAATVDRLRTVPSPKEENTEVSTSPVQMSEARRFQQLRGQLSCLKLNDAAAALDRCWTRPAPLERLHAGELATRGAKLSQLTR
ncbi:hypothetical protein ACGF8B_32305 [Streptomyces sp. NPDC047917]|uniref:hypothetical protein n=1 Tax=Streptomyces sp. NPDC047917 TaxID=3365491 RepID=UPI003720F28B